MKENQHRVLSVCNIFVNIIGFNDTLSNYFYNVDKLNFTKNYKSKAVLLPFLFRLYEVLTKILTEFVVFLGH